MPGTEQEWTELANSRLRERRVPRFWADKAENIEPGTVTFVTEEEIKQFYPQPDEAKSDEVNHPDHYNNGKVEAIEAIEASMSEEEFRGYLKGNALKYMWRYRYKGKPKQDLEKAKWYLDKLISRM